MNPQLQNMEDQGGNKVRVKQGKVFLHMKGTSQVRHIGTIDDKTKELVVKRNRTKHLYRASVSYGFNYHIIKNTTRFDKVRLIDQVGTYVIPVDVILDEGKFLHHQKAGMEVQLFLPLDIIENYEVKG